VERDSGVADVILEELAVRRRTLIVLGEDGKAAEGVAGARGGRDLEPGARTPCRFPVVLLGGLHVDAGEKGERASGRRAQLGSAVGQPRIDGVGLSIAKDPACPKVPGDGTARGLNATVTSGPSDCWITPDGAYLYQIYGNASKLVGYATQPDGSLTEITSAKIPYNSPQGLAGF